MKKEFSGTITYGVFPTRKKSFYSHGKREYEMSHIISTGTYPLSGEAFDIDGRKIIIRHRKEPSARKPELFLSAVDPYCYISSLYPSEDGFTADEEGKKFRVDINGNSIIFSKL